VLKNNPGGTRRGGVGGKRISEGGVGGKRIREGGVLVLKESPR
jgi:hypothetical protein